MRVRSCRLSLSPLPTRDCDRSNLALCSPSNSESADQPVTKYPGFIRTLPLWRSRACAGATGTSTQYDMGRRQLHRGSPMRPVRVRWTTSVMNVRFYEPRCCQIGGLWTRTDMPSSSCKTRPAVMTASCIPVTCTSTATVLTSTAGLAYTGGVTLLPMQETVINNDCAF